MSRLLAAIRRLFPEPYEPSDRYLSECDLDFWSSLRDDAIAGGNMAAARAYQSEVRETRAMMEALDRQGGRAA